MNKGPMNPDTFMHVRGESIFIDDMPEFAEQLHLAVYFSGAAHGKITSLDVAEAAAAPGVARVITAKDIPGENQIGGIFPDEPLLADGTVHFVGDPIAIVAARTREEAYAARQKISCAIAPLPAITDPREAFKQGKLIQPPRTFALGSVDHAWAECDFVLEGRADSGGQEHVYLETQIAVAVPQENKEMKIYSSTQSPTVVQKAAARVLGVPQHAVEIEVKRLGGAFGGKEDQATAWAAMAALAARVTGKPCKISLDRREDITFTGKRHPYSSDFKIGMKKDGTIHAFQAMYYQNSGAVADLSTSILERTLYHATNSYDIPNVRVTAAACYTNLHPYTAFRGFGGPQGMYVMEAAIRLAAEKLGVPAHVLQRKNLLREGSLFPYGMYVERCQAERCFDALTRKNDLAAVQKRIDDYNAKNADSKKGFAIMPICFGISFTTLFLNQAAALVHVYADGSVNVSTGVVEMGQGVHMKIMQVVAKTFSIDLGRVRTQTTNTFKCANTSPTAASSGADMNGKAAEIACADILGRIRAAAAAILGHNAPHDIQIIDEVVWCEGRKTELAWKELIQKAYLMKTQLSAYGHYSVPGLTFDKTKEKGRPFAYHVYGTAFFEATLDLVRGTYRFDAVKIVHDIGRSINLRIDQGQVMGAMMQGLGWMTMEELLYSPEGRPLIDTLSKYKVPDMRSTPPVLELDFLENADNPYAVMNSKAVGEPPLMYGIGAYFALINAMAAARPGKELPWDSPLTPKKTLAFLYE